MSKINRIMIGLPWYGGPDVDCYPRYFEMLHYLGRLRERSLWLAAVGEQGEKVMATLPPLDPWRVDGDQTEIVLEDGIFDFSLSDQTRLSLPGLARERLVDTALQYGADWLFMWDADMIFPWSTLLRLWRHNKPVVNALGFSARDPVVPCLYKIKEGFDTASRGPVYDSEVIYDYPRNKLIGSEDVGGALAFGAGVLLVNLSVFRQIPKPWFNSTGCGEDWFFCVRCHLAGIPRYVDTSIKVLHKGHKVSWYSESFYEEERQLHPETYKKLSNREPI